MLRHSSEVQTRHLTDVYSFRVHRIYSLHFTSKRHQPQLVVPHAQHLGHRHIPDINASSYSVLLPGHSTYGSVLPYILHCTGALYARRQVETLQQQQQQQPKSTTLHYYIHYTSDTHCDILCSANTANPHNSINSLQSSRHH